MIVEVIIVVVIIVIIIIVVVVVVILLAIISKLQGDRPGDAKEFGEMYEYVVDTDDHDISWCCYFVLVYSKMCV